MQVCGPGALAILGAMFVAKRASFALAAALLLAGVPPGQSARSTQDTPRDAARDAHKAPDAPDVGLTQDLAQLADLLGKAHGVDPDAPQIKSFRANIRLEPRQGKDSITADIGVDFLAPMSMRCEVREKGVRVERGMDPKLGPWEISGDEVVKLQGPEMTQAADRVASELRLCRQMLRFLDPKRLLASLKNPSALRQSDLEITKRLAFRGCTVVDGMVDKFPTYSLGDQGPAHVTLFVHPDTNQLLAVNAVPLDDAGKPRELAELVLLDQYAETQGMRLPSELTVFRVAGPGREALVTVKILGIELRREFAADHFARPTK